MSATRLKTGRGKHFVMLVSAGSPTLDSSASSATGQYIKAGSYCNVETDNAGGLKFTNITSDITTPTTGDNGYIAQSVIFNFSADTMTDKWGNTLSTVEVVTDVSPGDEAVNSPYQFSLEYSNGSNTVVTADQTDLFICPAAIEITNVDIKAGTYTSSGSMWITKDGTNILSTNITVTSVLQTAVLNSDSKLLTADQVIGVTVGAATWTGTSHLTATVNYKYR